MTDDESPFVPAVWVLLWLLFMWVIDESNNDDCASAEVLERIEALERIADAMEVKLK